MSHAQQPPQQPGGVAIGLPGTPLTRHHAVEGPVANALAVFEARSPWIVPHSTPLIRELLNAGVTYAFDTLDELFWWARIRLFTRHLLALSTQQNQNGTPPGLQAWRARYQLVEAQRAEFQRVGDLGAGPQAFTFLGRQYALTRQGPDHYYATRHNANIGYSGRLTDTSARGILVMLHRQSRNEPFDPTTLDDGAVDEFVCAYLAEPTRWREEHIYNLLAIKNDPQARMLTGGNGTTLLPMATGGTWEQALHVVGAQTPKRIVLFAQGLWLTRIIDQEIPAAHDLDTFLSLMRTQYGL